MVSRNRIRKKNVQPSVIGETQNRDSIAIDGIIVQPGDRKTLSMAQIHRQTGETHRV